MSNMDKISYGASTALSRPEARGRHFTTDSFMTFDQVNQFTVDSSGAFLVGELERLDQTLHDPLVAVTWGRDIQVREDVTMADEDSSFTVSGFATSGGMTPGGISWISKDANAIPGISLDIGKIIHPLNLWGKELKYSLPELASAAKLGRPVDQQKYDGMKLAWQMDIDQVVYTGDQNVGGLNFYGLFNSTLVTPQNVATKFAGGTQWITSSGGFNATPDEILADINFLLNRVWVASAVALVPSELRLPPASFNAIASAKVSSAGNVSILEFVRNNSLCNAVNGKPLNIQPVKWLTGLGASATNRMVAYTNDKDRVRLPLVPLQRTPLEYRSLYNIVTYYGRIGEVELVYPTTIGYSDGL